jgi:hypothetical protein
MIHGHTADLSISVSYDPSVHFHRNIESNIESTLAFMTQNVFNRFIIDVSDPMYYTLVASLHECLAHELKIDHSRLMMTSPIILPDANVEVARVVNLIPFERAKNSPIYDILRSYFITDFCPSTDNLVKWFYDLVNSRIGKLGVTIEQVSWSSIPSRKFIHKSTNRI